MSAQGIIFDARVSHVRELKAEIARLRGENTRLRAELDSLRAHFDQALLAAEDLRTLPPGGRLEVWDGWNLVLGAGRVAGSREELVAKARGEVAAAGGALRVWIVFDGPRGASRDEGGVRVSYTGGGGSQRTDRMVVDYVRMAAWLGLGGRVSVRTNDKDFGRQVARILSGGGGGVAP